MLFDKHFIKTVLHDAFIVNEYSSEDPKFCIDSRKLEYGEIFVALKGSKVDGHEFILEAFQKGAAGCVIDKKHNDILKKLDKKLLEKKFIVQVNNTFDAFVALAHAWRLQFEYPVVGITGTIGKTSTKELLANILSLNGTDYIASFENQNTLLGAALNLFRMRAHHKIAIMEMGISKRGEMKKLAKLIMPKTAVITNIGHQHMDGLGSLVDIALEKRDIFSCFTEDSIGIINGDQAVLSEVSYQHPVIKFGSKTTNQIQVRKVRVSGSHASFILKIYSKKYPIVLKQPHLGSVFNTLAATAVAHLFNVADDIITKAIQMPLVIAGRFEERLMKQGKGILINDSYNSNPESMKASLLAFQNIETKSKKIAVIGDMLGLGVNSPFWHRQIGRFLKKAPSLRRVILVGNLVSWIKKAAPIGVLVDIVPDWKEAIILLKKELNDDVAVLVKGSHDIGLNNLVDQLT